MRIRTFGGLWIEGPSGSPALGPRPLALLALVASAGRRGISRDRLIGILWPEAGEEQARHTLSQTVYSLKRDTGRDWVIAGTDLRLDPAINSDIGELQDALAAGSHETVDALATGVFLEGFYLGGAPEFERWVEEERARIQSQVLRALETLSARADASQDHAASVRWWTRLTDVDPFGARYAIGRMRALAAAGDGATALAHARLYEETVRRELDADVDPAIRKLVATLRAESAPLPVEPPVIPGPQVSGLAETPGVPPRSSSRRRMAPSLVLLAAAGAVVGFMLFRPGASPRAPFLAVGDIRIDSAQGGPRLGSILRDMLATSLSGVEGLQVVANSRLIELLPRETAEGVSGTSDAARRAGATEMIEGELTTEAAGLVLTLRRVALSNGVLRKGYVIRAADRYAVVDSATAAIALDLRLVAPPSSVAEIRTSSPAAYALYEEGLRAHFGYDAPAAYRLMTAALARDSNFAMAAYYAWSLSQLLSMEQSIQAQALARAQRLAPRATERERLLIQTSLADVDAPLAVAAARAETLTVRFPTDPDGQYLLARIRHSEGDYARAVAAARRAFALDSAAGALAGPNCRACFALGQMMVSYLWWDSAGAAERVGRRLIAMRPHEEAHWRGLVEPLLRQGLRGEAEAAVVKGGGVRSGVNGLMLRDLLRWGRHEEADRLLTEDAMSLDEITRAEGWWLLVLNLRDQGRLREADTLIHQYRIPGTQRRVPAPGPEPVDLALLAMEMGRPQHTVRAHRANAEIAGRSNAPIALRARDLVWNLTLAGTAHAASGDTAIVRRLADSVEVVGRDSHWARDVRLHFMLRGLVHQLAGRHAEAIEAFQRSLYSLTDGYTRTNLMMARSLLALRRPAEAIAVLRPAIRGGVDGSNTYVSRTELREALAQAFEMAGQSDSARVHFAEVERAWRRADPQFQDRYETARRKAGS